MADNTRTIAFVYAIKIIDVVKKLDGPKRIDGATLQFASFSIFEICQNLNDTFGLLQLGKRLALRPGKGGSMLQSVLLVCFSFFKSIRMPFLKPNPLDLLLEEAESAAASRAPVVILRDPNARGEQDVHYARLVD